MSNSFDFIVSLKALVSELSVVFKLMISSKMLEIEERNLIRYRI